MKFKNFSFIVFLFALFLFAAMANAQSAFTANAEVSTGDGVRQVLFIGSIDSTDTLTSNTFKLTDCSAIIDVWINNIQANDSVKLKGVWEYRTFNDTWLTAATTFTDSTPGSAVFADTILYNPVEHRLKIIGMSASAGGTAANGVSTNFNVAIRSKLE